MYAGNVKERHAFAAKIYRAKRKAAREQNRTSEAAT
jgi:hypothetical protein